MRAIPVSSRITTLWRSRIIGEVPRSPLVEELRECLDRTPASRLSTCAAMAEGASPIGS